MPTETFSFTGAEQTFSVPADVTRTIIKCYGAGGADGGETNAGIGAPGGYAEDIISTSPGETLYVYVGGAASGRTGGFNGGGDGGDGDVDGGGGGGASDVRQGGNAIGDRVVIGGGGGGGGGGGFASDAGDGGAGGGQSGADGQDAAAGGAQGGAGGTQTTGRSDGTGGPGATGDPGGGGGGAGYFGGEGGGADSGNPAAGGGGGSGLGSTLTQGGGNAGDGEIILAYVETPQDPTIAAFDATSITLDWNPATGADEYTVYRATASGSAFGDYTEIATTATVGYTDTGLLNGERYFYRVTATDTSESVESGLSAEVDQVTNLPAPTNLTHPAVADASADYAWTANANNGTIRVEYKDAADAAWTTFSTVGNAVEAETVTGLLMGNVYDSRVVAQTEHTETIDA